MEINHERHYAWEYRNYGAAEWLRRAPSRAWLSEEMQAEMKKIETCLHCGQCMQKCPYSLNTPELLQTNFEDYKRILAGEVSVE